MNPLANPLVTQAVAIVVRYGLVTLFTALGLTDIGAPYMDELVQHGVAIVGVAGTLLYALWRLRYNRQKQAVALASPRPMTEHQAELAITYGYVPSTTTPKSEIPQ